MGLHGIKRALSFIGGVISKYIFMREDERDYTIGVDLATKKKPMRSLVTPEQRKKFVKPDWVKKEKSVGLGQNIAPMLKDGDIIIERVVVDMETGRKHVEKTVVKKEDAEGQKNKCAHWALSEAPKNAALDGAPGYIIVSDNFGKAVKTKVTNINVDTKDVKVDKDKYKLQGELRITGRIPVK